MSGGGAMRNRRICAGGAGAGARAIHVTVPTGAASSTAIAAVRQSNRGSPLGLDVGRGSVLARERVERKREIAGRLEPEVRLLLDAPVDDPP